MADVKYPPGTVDVLVDAAKRDRNKILWFGTYMPWTSVAGGMFLVLAAVVVMRLSARPRSAQAF